VTDPFLPEEDSTPEEKAPWGFRLTLFLAALYLLWRLVQAIGWLIDRF